MRNGNSSPLVDYWVNAYRAEFGRLDLRSTREQLSFQDLLNQADNRTTGRQQRLSDDSPAVPTPLWIALIFGGCAGWLEGHYLPGDAGAWALIGMAAMMGGTMRSPLTGILFAVELTGDFALLDSNVHNRIRPGAIARRVNVWQAGLHRRIRFNAPIIQRHINLLQTKPRRIGHAPSRDEYLFSRDAPRAVSMREDNALLPPVGEGFDNPRVAK